MNERNLKQKVKQYERFLIRDPYIEKSHRTNKLFFLKKIFFSIEFFGNFFRSCKKKMKYQQNKIKNFIIGTKSLYFESL